MQRSNAVCGKNKRSAKQKQVVLVLDSKPTLVTSTTPELFILWVFNVLPTPSFLTACSESSQKPE